MSWSPSPPPTRKALPKSPAKATLKSKPLARPPLTSHQSGSNDGGDGMLSLASGDVVEHPVDLFSTGIQLHNEEQAFDEGGEAKPQERISMYVKIVDEMLSTVIKGEAYLFTSQELSVLQKYQQLEYGPKYLLTRLLLRKTNKIFSEREMVAKYSSELGQENIPEIMDQLVQCKFDNQTDSPDAADTPPKNTPNVSSLGMSAVAAPSGKGVTAKPLTNFREPSLDIVEISSDSEIEQANQVITTKTHMPSESESVTRHQRTTTPERRIVIEIPSSPAEPIVHKPKPLTRTRTRKNEPDSVKKTLSPGPTPVPSDDNDDDNLDSFYTFKKLSKMTSAIDAFATGIDTLELEDLINQLGMTDLVKIGKELKLWKSKLNRTELIQTLLQSANQQSRLSFKTVERPSSSPQPNADSKLRQQQLPFTTFSKPKNESLTARRSPRKTKLTGRALLLDKIAQAYGGRAIRIHLPFRSLIHRLNLVYYRSTITPSTGVAKSLMLPNILTRSGRRSYPDVVATRSKVWATRDALLDYEAALEMEAMVDEALGEQNHSTGNWAGQSGYGFGRKGGRVEGARRVKKAWKSIHETWLQAVAVAEKQPDRSTTGSRHVLDRFELGHILTRVVSKGSTALGILHEYDQECDLLRLLLAQRVWRRGKRGAWYDRMALVLMTHYSGDLKKKRQAVKVCIDGLEDPDTHLIYRPRLSRRLKRLEKQLDLSKSERHICEAELGQPFIRHLKAHRIVAPVQRRTSVPLRSYWSTTKDVPESPQDNGEDDLSSSSRREMGKSVWLGREGEVGVEDWVLEWWDQEKWKGFHSESSILTTLFTLIFWPIIFLPLPGAFETPYQLAPLDLGADSFYESRTSLIETRLAKMRKTSECMTMLIETDTRERPNQTLAVGVDWSFERADLLEIVQCIGGRALSVICRMFCEEYGFRASGVPDLIVWNFSEKRARFVEVKSPNDQLSETQKIWISVLKAANVEIEVCRVDEVSDPKQSSLKRLMTRPTPDRPSKRRKTSEEMNRYYNLSLVNGSDQGESDEEDSDGPKLRGEGILLRRAEIDDGWESSDG